MSVLSTLIDRNDLLNEVNDTLEDHDIDLPLLDELLDGLAFEVDWDAVKNGVLLFGGITAAVAIFTMVRPWVVAKLQQAEFAEEMEREIALAYIDHANGLLNKDELITSIESAKLTFEIQADSADIIASNEFKRSVNEMLDLLRSAIDVVV